MGTTNNVEMEKYLIDLSIRLIELGYVPGKNYSSNFCLELTPINIVMVYSELKTVILGID